ncbi:hypothetical protein O6H91_Y044000 [Diphasiastrum complanatum]|nr:hypothetical protein O6H91_Y044000 [Diphasiastrum complanatum]
MSHKHSRHLLLGVLKIMRMTIGPTSHICLPTWILQITEFVQSSKATPLSAFTLEMVVLLKQNPPRSSSNCYRKFIMILSAKEPHAVQPSSRYKQEGMLDNLTNV